jgi:hypothetical protein
LRGSLKHRKADCRNDQDAKKRHLEAGGEKLARIDDEQSQSRCTERIRHGSIAIEQPGAKIDGTHQRSPPDGGADLRDECVACTRRNCE